MKRSHLIALVSLVAVLVVASAVSVAVFSRRVQVLSGQRVECVYGHLIKDDVKTVEVRPSQASKYGVKVVTTVCADHRRAERLYREAQEALAKGDVKTAEAKLAEVVTIDRSFKKASAQLTQLDGGKKPAPDTDTQAASDDAIGTAGDAGAGGDGSDKAPTGPVASLAGWTPDVIEGFTPEPIMADSLSLSREYRATSGDVTLVIAAEQVGTVTAVKDELKARVKLPYDRDTDTFKVGDRSAYAGTDGRSVAVVGIPDGPVLVVLQMRAAGADPKDSLGALIKIAKALPK